MTETWGLMAKSQIDNEKVEEAIDRIVQQHDDDPTSHLADGQSLTSHRASEIIDHRARSVVNDKIIEVARSYTAIMQIPTTTAGIIFYGEPSYFDGPVEYVPSSKTFSEIMSRGITADDSEYVILKYNAYGDNYFLADGATVPTGKKIYKLKIKCRLKIVDNTVSSMNVDLSYADGSSTSLTVTTAWQNFEYEMLYGQDSDDVWQAWQEQILNTGFIGLQISKPTSDGTKNNLAISQFYIEPQYVDDIYNEDYFDLKSAVDYVNSLGGGSIFIKNGVYDLGPTFSHVGSNVSIVGQSLAGVILNSSDVNDNIQIGTYGAEEYSTGTITLTQNSDIVTGTLGTWTSAKTLGKYIVDKKTGKFYKIIAWISGIQIKINEVYQGATSAGRAYIIIPCNTECLLQNVTITCEVAIWGIVNCRLDNIRIDKGICKMSYCENLDVFDSEFVGLVSASLGDYICNSTFSQNTYSNCIETTCLLKATSVGNIVENNVFENNKGQCIVIYGQNNVIKGNTIFNNGWTLGQLYPPIITASTSSKNIIANNVVTDNNSYGIGSATGANYNIVIGNIVLNNYSSGIVNNGAQSITANNIV